MGATCGSVRKKCNLGSELGGLTRSTTLSQQLLRCIEACRSCTPPVLWLMLLAYGFICHAYVCRPAPLHARTELICTDDVPVCSCTVYQIWYPAGAQQRWRV